MVQCATTSIESGWSPENGWGQAPDDQQFDHAMHVVGRFF